MALVVEKKSENNSNYQFARRHNCIQQYFYNRI